MVITRLPEPMMGGAILCGYNKLTQYHFVLPILLPAPTVAMVPIPLSHLIGSHPDQNTVLPIPLPLPTMITVSLLLLVPTSITESILAIPGPVPTSITETILTISVPVPTSITETVLTNLPNSLRNFK